ncbi:hypothetical protein [Thauera humireducens]|uniref:Uncharacterized protein n=1 Tax=Thauera humireducens TaxID=1134435 RepID=A0A127K461_9RHOO|nr:hypothetical protein [Thauera humireducens]AMO36749.1 hypothetical protein AC731_007200 [Thauera humireducens]
MSVSWNFYNDPALTSLQSAGATVTEDLGPTDRIVYFGSPMPGKTLRTAIGPGSNQITIAPADGGPGSGADVSQVKLALTAGGLDTAVGGAAISVGTELSSGAANKITVFVRTEQGSQPVGLADDLFLTTNAVVES